MPSVSAGRLLRTLAEAKWWFPHGWNKITAVGRSPYTATEQFHYRLIREVLHSNPRISGEENKENSFSCDVHNRLYLINCSSVKLWIKEIALLVQLIQQKGGLKIASNFSFHFFQMIPFLLKWVPSFVRIICFINAFCIRQPWNCKGYIYSLQADCPWRTMVVVLRIQRFEEHIMHAQGCLNTPKDS